MKADASETTPPSMLLLKEAEDHYADALRELLALRRSFQDREDLPEAEMKRVVGTYARATQTLFDERKKVEELGKRIRGTVLADAIDFDAVRDEIGRRLDRLRAVAGPVGVPGRAE
ncbi:hypothetical protein [Oceaniglobus roseus]|uniref:hypothetical protein n=1 Tax=Oceaniglobus roseus TaxID=1737570 RepID=UPI0015622283|nr:hypothetical protein [Kandeliimicrobium roseum]